MSRLALSLLPVVLLGSLSLAAPVPSEAKVKAKAKVEFRWLASKPVKGLTEGKGIQTTCGDELSYPHLKAVLTADDVAATKMTNSDFSKNGLPGDHITIEFFLSKEAKETLVEACGDSPGGVLAVFVDGRYWGTSNFEKKGAATFAPRAGFISSKAEAERIVEACRK